MLGTRWPRVGIIRCVGLCGLVGVACVSKLGGGTTEDNSARCAPIVGASSGSTTNVVSDSWYEAPVRFGNTLKMLNFEQLKSELAAVTGADSTELASAGAAFGAANYKTVFQDDRTPTSSKLIAYRKIAYKMCTEMITREGNTRALFSEVAPSAAISAQDPKVAAQVKKIFARVFLEEPTQVEIDHSTNALGQFVAEGSSPAEAWTGLCVGYLSSMRFLTY